MKEISRKFWLQMSNRTSKSQKSSAISLGGESNSTVTETCGTNFTFLWCTNNQQKISYSSQMRTLRKLKRRTKSQNRAAHQPFSQSELLQVNRASATRTSSTGSSRPKIRANQDLLRSMITLPSETSTLSQFKKSLKAWRN